jgi:hypothetical protein
MQEIESLDRALQRAGFDIVLRRSIGTANQSHVDVECRAAVRTPEEHDLVPGITVRQTKVIISPTEINRQKWPGAQPPTVVGDPRVPSKDKGDKVRINNQWRAVERANPIYIADELVRIEMIVLG